MLGSIGMPEMIFIMLLALLVFGPKRLPQVGRTVGKGLREFRRATSDLKRSVEVGMHEDEVASARPVAMTPKPDVAEAKPASEVAVEEAVDTPETTDPAESSASAKATD